jgi:hypothetical protein
MSTVLREPPLNTANSAAPYASRPRVAVVDGASFVLPYDLQLVAALSRAGAEVDFYGSTTRYNGELLQAVEALPGARVHTAAVSGTVASRWRGLLAYLGLWWRLFKQRQRFTTINLQFAPLGWLEWPLWWWLRGRLVFTVHNAVPHGFAGQRHGPTAALARLARTLVFASDFSRADFLRRYGQEFAARSVVIPHGLLPPAPGVAARAYTPDTAAAPPQGLVFWGNVQAYKGVELFEALATSPELKARGLSLQVHGAWTPELQPLALRLRALGVQVFDRFLDAGELQALMAQPVVFLLPYTQATQSGALFSLLHQGSLFLCSGVGDLGDFLRRHDLPELLLPERNAQAVWAALDRLAADPTGIARRLAAAQSACDWDHALGAARTVYWP